MYVCCIINNLILANIMRISHLQCRTIAILLFVSINAIAFSQISMFEPNKNTGKPTIDEYSMTTYAPDTTASAVYLCKKGYARYYYDERTGFRIDYEYEHRIKIIESDGISYADVEIPYRNNGDIRSSNEDVIEISATSYNMENGKVVKTKMKRDLIFKERANKNTMVAKFSIPAVKVGTIIEYKYKISSFRIWELRNWYAQSHIPVMYGEFDISIPEYFNFNLEIRGHDKIDCVQDRETASFHISYGGAQVNTVDCRASRLKFFNHKMPALKSDKYIWCDDDYISYVSFEMSGYSFPGQLYKSFSTSWDDIDKILLDDEEFGYRLKMKNPYKEEMATLGLEKLTSAEDKVSHIFTFLKSKIKWDETYNLYATDIKKDIKNGSGGNASINFILMSMIKDAGIENVPVVMSRRTHGILPITYPSLASLNTFVVGFVGADSTLKYIDASMVNGYINILPPILMVNKARIVSKEYPGQRWVDLSNTCLNVSRSGVTATVDTEGLIKGTYTTSYKGQYATIYRNKYKTAKDSATFVSDIENKENIKILSLSHEGVYKFSPEMRVEMSFEKNVDVNGDLIYLNPMIFIDKDTNPFTQEERKLPVEMPFTDDVAIAINLTIPEGYEIEEQPKPQIIKLEGNGGQCSYMCNLTDTGIVLQYKFSLKSMIFPGTKYAQLRNFCTMVANKNNEMIVLKKKIEQLNTPQ